MIQGKPCGKWLALNVLSRRIYLTKVNGKEGVLNVANGEAKRSSFSRVDRGVTVKKE